MGKKKSSVKPIAPKKQETVPKIFDCPFCFNSKCVTVKLDLVRKAGEIRCRVCDVNFQSVIHALTEPIDVYSDWIDDAKAANEKRNDGS